jgi:hypothetical protein
LLWNIRKFLNPCNSHKAIAAFEIHEVVARATAEKRHSAAMPGFTYNLILGNHKNMSNWIAHFCFLVIVSKMLATKA